MENKQDNFWVIGIGASAGGLEALSTLLKALPSDLEASYIVAQHLAPHAKSMMVDLLKRQTQLPVVAVKDHLQIRPGEISIVPPSFDVSAMDGELRLIPAGPATRPKPSVDIFLQSLAKIYGRRAVGIILSGTGTDGSEGIRAIKENGGVTIVQDSESAKYDGMPKSAFETGLVDAVLPPEIIGEKLSSILNGKERGESGPDDYDPDEQVDFKKILSHLKKEMGTDFCQYKTSTIQRRIEKRLAFLNQKDLKEYYSFLRKNPAELTALSQNMLVSVTSFFRDPEAFKAIEGQLQELIRHKSNDVNDEENQLRVWVAGCATGEEAYSLAFVILHLCEKLGRTLNIKIFSTDLDQEALAVARGGIYSKEEIEGVPEDFNRRYLDRHENHYEIKKYIREILVFARQDLVQNPPFVKLDLISCRNVLIYFENTLQSRIFDLFHYALRPGGLLFLGKSETANPALFETLDRKEKIYRRMNVLSSLSSPPSGKYTLNSGTLGHTGRKKGHSAPTLAEVAPMQLLQMHELCGVVVDEESAIHHIIGDVSRFIGLPSGSADFRLNNLLPRSAAVEFSVHLKKASKSNKTLRSRIYHDEQGGKKDFIFSVKSLDPMENISRQLFLVSFEFREHYSMDELSPGELNAAEMDAPLRMAELEHELASTRENLQTVIEELEVSNEEMQSLNEELSSTNEELQASNEELETTNEELQSTNEELITLNEELNVKSSELRLAYTSLENIQSSISSPLLVVDSELRLLRFNANAHHIFNVGFSDMGQVITKLYRNCEILNFEKMMTETIKSGKINEAVCLANNKVYQLRIHPSQDESKKTIGAVLIFFDNTEVLNVQEKLKISDKRLRSIMDCSPTLISLKDSSGRYLMVNEAFTLSFGLSEDQVLGKTDRDLFSNELAGQLRDSDLEILLKRETLQKEETINYGGQCRVFLSNRFPLFMDNEKNPYAVGTVSLDITTQVEAKKALVASEERYKAMIEDQAVFVCRYDLAFNIVFTNATFRAYFRPRSGGQLNLFTCVDKRDHQRIRDELAQISISHPIVQYEHRFLTPDGDIKWIRWIQRGIFGESDVLIEYQGVGFDVTEIHTKTSELLSKENIFTHVLEHTSDYLSVYRVEGENVILDSFNQNGRNRSFGQPRLIGKNLKEIIHNESVIQKFESCIEKRTIISFEETLDGPGGLIYLNTTLVPVKDPIQGGLKVVAIGRDITKLKRAEKQILQEIKNAESANMAKSDFLASMSHELRTPLNVIMGMSQLLARGEIRPEQLKLVESIQRSGKVLLALIEDVLDLSKIEAGKISFEMKSFNVGMMVSDVLHTFEAQVESKGLKLLTRLNFPPELHLLGDQIRLKQILINLIGNAIKFTERGSVTLSMSAENLSSSVCTLYCEVEDTGIGIPGSAYPKIFKRFSQADSGTSRKFGGTGLGLAICKQLVELMNGNIGFQSEEGKGSTFWFKIQLPVSKQDRTKKLPTSGPSDFSSFKALAVDDNPESLKVLKLLFEERNGSLDLATNGVEALKMIEENAYNVVLMDMQMPGLNGLETTQKIRSLPDAKKSIPIIALTANAMAADKERCLASGMNDFLTKPLDFDLLNVILKKWV